MRASRGPETDPGRGGRGWTAPDSKSASDAGWPSPGLGPWPGSGGDPIGENSDGLPSMGSPKRRTIFGAIELARGRRSPPGPPAPASLGSWNGWWPPTPRPRPSPFPSTTTHRCRAVTRWLGEHRVRLVFGPRSCPHHHPVERIRGALKTYLANTPVETMGGRVGQVQAFFGERSQEQRLRCASPFRSPLPQRKGVGRPCSPPCRWPRPGGAVDGMEDAEPWLRRPTNLLIERLTDLSVRTRHPSRRGAKPIVERPWLASRQVVYEGR